MGGKDGESKKRGRWRSVETEKGPGGCGGTETGPTKVATLTGKKGEMLDRLRISRTFRVEAPVSGRDPREGLRDLRRLAQSGG